MSIPEANEEVVGVTTGEERSLFPGERLYGASRRVLFLCFFAVFILTAHQHLFAGHQRSKIKLIILMCLAPLVIGSGLCALIGWWQMRRAGAFPQSTAVEAEGQENKNEKSDKKRSHRRERRDGSELLPWQRREKR
mgnify:CR=1 FL=1